MSGGEFLVPTPKYCWLQLSNVARLMSPHRERNREACRLNSIHQFIDCLCICLSWHVEGVNPESRKGLKHAAEREKLLPVWLKVHTVLIEYSHKGITRCRPDRELENVPVGGVNLSGEVIANCQATYKKRNAP